MKQTYDEIFDVLKEAYETSSLTKLSSDSVAEKKMQAIAGELYAVSCYGDFILKQAFVQTASGEYLDRHGEMRGCVRKDGEPAKGVLVFGVSSPAQEDILIEKGTFCSKAGDSLIQFYTLADTTIKAGQTSAYAAAKSASYGEKYNVNAGEVTVLVNAPAGVETVTNALAFSGGTDKESDAVYRQRIIESFRLPVNGFSKSFAENKIKALDYIIDCKINDSSEVGKIKVIAATNEEITAERADEITGCIDYRDLFGFTVSITKAKKIPIDIMISVSRDFEEDDDKLSAELYSAFSEILDRREIGENILLDELRECVFSYDGVKGAQFSCDLIMNDAVVSPDDGYLFLDNLEVKLNEL